MNISKRVALHLSLSVIVLYWLYELFLVNHSQVSFNNFYDFVVRVAIIKAIHLSVIIVLLKIEKERWNSMGFQAKNWKQFGTGILLGIGMFLFINVGLTSVLNSMFPHSTKGSGSILQYFNDTRNLYIWLLLGIFAGGVVEEVMRIFILTRFQKRFDNAGLYFALICSSVVFGLGHLYQGVGSAIATGIAGLILGVIFIRRRSAIEVITIHAVSDVLAILTAFVLASRHNLH